MTWYAVPAKYDLWFVFVLAGLGWAVIAGLYVYIAEPYLVFEEWRKTEAPEEIEVRYSAGDCDGVSSSLCVAARYSESVQRDDGDMAVVPRYLSVLEGVPCPDKTELAVGGNEFLLSGYRYVAHYRNVITGRSEETSSWRVDVVAWEVETPYSAVRETAGDETVTENLHEPVSYAMTAEDHAPENFWIPDDESDRTKPCFEKPS